VVVASSRAFTAHAGLADRRVTGNVLPTSAVRVSAVEPSLTGACRGAGLAGHLTPDGVMAAMGALECLRGGFPPCAAIRHPPPAELKQRIRTYRAHRRYSGHCGDCS
jgi:hypothetical protein